MFFVAYSINLIDNQFGITKDPNFLDALRLEGNFSPTINASYQPHYLLPRIWITGTALWLFHLESWVLY